MIEYAYQYNLPLLALMVFALIAVLWQMRTMLHKHFKDGAHTITYIAYRQHVVVNINAGVLQEFTRAEVLTAIRKALNWKHLEITTAATVKLEKWIESDVKDRATFVQGCLCELRTPARYKVGYDINVRVDDGELIATHVELPHPTRAIAYGCSLDYATLGVARTLASLVTGKGLWSTYLDEVWGLEHRIYTVLSPAVKKYHLVNTLGTLFFSTVTLAVTLTWLYDGTYWPMVLFAIWLAAVVQFSGGNLLSTLADRIDDSWLYSRYPDTDLVLAAEEPSRKATRRFVVMLVAFLAGIIATISTATVPITSAGVIGMTLATVILGASGAGFLTYLKEFLEVTERLDRLHYARELGIEDCNHVV